MTATRICPLTLSCCLAIPSSPPLPVFTGRCMHVTSARCWGALPTRSGTLSHSLPFPHSLDLCFFIYRALYARDIGALLGGSSNKNLPNMRNLAMELRKLCCHPVRRQDVWESVGKCGQGVGSLNSLQGDSITCAWSYQFAPNPCPATFSVQRE